MAESLASVGWVDWALLVVVLLSLCVGLWRGLVFEVLSLLGWVASYVAAQAFSPRVAPYLPVGEPGSGLHVAAAFAVTFIGAMIVWMIAARLIRLLIHMTPLTIFDRVLGAGFGLLRGVLVLLVVATVVAMTPAVQAPAWQHSTGAAWLSVMLDGLKPVLPPEVGRHLPD